MHAHEARLHAMLKEPGAWNLSEEDRAAIEWVLAFAASEREAKDRAFNEVKALWNLWRETGKRVETHAREMDRLGAWMHSVDSRSELPPRFPKLRDD